MKKALLAFVACISAAVALTALTPEETLDRRGIGDLDFSPDGSQLTYTVTEPVKGTTRARSIHAWACLRSAPTCSTERCVRARGTTRYAG